MDTLLYTTPNGYRRRTCIPPNGAPPRSGGISEEQLLCLSDETTSDQYGYDRYEWQDAVRNVVVNTDVYYFD
ncbi:MAG TPA: hypothetical protein VF630_15325, partial [Hymenobacter sp.]